MSNHVLPLTDATFAAEVLQSADPVLVDFNATWCPPCRAMEPILEALATAYEGRLKIASLNVDDHQQAAEQFGIRAMPTLLLFKQGRVVKQLVGAVPRAKLDAVIREAL